MMKKITGTIISNKMAKTVVVEVEEIKIHPKYLKRYHTSRRFFAHNELPDVAVGDKVVIQESKPISKNKNWKVVSKA